MAGIVPMPGQIAWMQPGAHSYGPAASIPDTYSWPDVFQLVWLPVQMLQGESDVVHHGEAASYGASSSLAPNIGAAAFGGAIASMRRRRRRQAASQKTANTNLSSPAHVKTTVATTATPLPEQDVSAQASCAKDENHEEALFVSKLMAQLEAGGQDRDEAVQALHGCMRDLSFDPLGCRAVQLALQVVDRKAIVKLLAELHGCVIESISSPHANFVMQKVVELMPQSLASFVVDELLGLGIQMARHRYGCRVICRLVEQRTNKATDKVARLIDEVLNDTRQLCRHNYGHHVVNTILEHGLPNQKQRAVSVLHSDLVRLSKNRNSCSVIEKALVTCVSLDKQCLFQELLSNAEAMLSISEHPFGHLVVKALLAQPELAPQVRNLLQHYLPRLRESKFAKRLIPLASLPLSA